MAENFFAKLTGRWEGECQTWLEPDKLADSSSVRGEFRALLGGRFVAHTYESEIFGKPRCGEELIDAAEAKAIYAQTDD